MCLVEKQREMAKKKKKTDSLLFLIFISDSGTKRPLFFQLLQSRTGAGCGGCRGSTLRLARHRQVLPSCPSCPSAAIASSALEPSASGTAASSRRAGAARPAPGQTAVGSSQGALGLRPLVGCFWLGEPSPASGFSSREHSWLPCSPALSLRVCSSPPLLVKPCTAGGTKSRARVPQGVSGPRLEFKTLQCHTCVFFMSLFLTCFSLH